MLKVEHLSVSYGAIQAVRDISFEVGKGEIVSLIGNNGAGKSSTLKALTGIVKPAQGSIKLFDQEIAGVKAHKVSKLGMAMVPEGRGIFTRMTVLENLEMGAFNRPDKENVKSDLDKVFELFQHRCGPDHIVVHGHRFPVDLVLVLFEQLLAPRKFSRKLPPCILVKTLMHEVVVVPCLFILRRDVAVSFVVCHIRLF